MIPLLLALTATAAPSASVTSTSEPVNIDGQLDEAAWATAEPVTDFVRFQPVAGGPPPGHTDVRFLQDDKNLYVGVRVTGADYPLRARISRREDINADDQIGVYLDTFKDEQTGYIFYFNGLGIQQDIRVGPGFSSFSWNAVMRTKGQLTDDGFMLEIAIPWRSIKFPKPDGGPQTWGLILTRKIPSEGAKYSFPVTQRNHPRIFTQAADLTGVVPPGRGSGLELIPSLTLIQQASRPTPESPLTWLPLGRGASRQDWLKVVRPSLDARVGITPNLGLAATVNPDFSQVDQDPTFIDLNQRFAFVLPENRPFFLDGIEYFDDQHDTLYTRSVVDPVEGLKLSGREGPVSIGVLHAIDRNPAATVHERSTPGFDEADMDDAWALNDVVRARFDAFGEGYAGVTLVDKRIFGPDRQPRGQHHAAGGDVRVPFGDRWTLDLRHLSSWTGRQVGSLKYGQDMAFSVERAGGIGSSLWVRGNHVTPEARRETGFLNQSGLSQGVVGGGYTFEPAGPIDTLTPSGEIWAKAERNGEHQLGGWVGQDIVHHGIHSWSGWVEGSRVTEGVGEDADGRSQGLVTVDGLGGGLEYRAELGRVLAVAPRITGGRIMDFAALAPAERLTTTMVVTLRPTPGLRFDTTVSRDALRKADGQPVQATLVRHWTAWQFTQQLGLRSMIEHSAGNLRDDRLVTSVLLTWLENPGTAVHLGWVERTGLESGWTPLDRSVFLKASVLFRP